MRGPDAGGGLMKRCTKCRETKPADQFHKDSGRKDGRQYWCCSCKSEADVARRADPILGYRRRQGDLDYRMSIRGMITTQLHRTGAHLDQYTKFFGDLPHDPGNDFGRYRLRETRAWLNSRQ